MDSVLIVGGGGREHALLKALLRSDRPLCMYAYPGNAGMENDGCMLVDREIDSWYELVDWSVENEVDLAIIGPEVPLVEGIVDIFQHEGISVFGPSKEAAQLEGSKYFSKNLMKKYNIPTASFESFTSKNSAMEYIHYHGTPLVVKVDGLAAGKGAIVCETPDEAENALKRIYDINEFGEAGRRVVIEEKMIGEEASIFALTDGIDYKILPVSQDHKAIFDGDKGPNTGGMGAYAPIPLVDKPLLERIEKEIIKKTIDAMAHEGKPYNGLLYAGLMITEDGPKVIEYNCRFGDPETQAVLPLVVCDWFNAFAACTDGSLASVEWRIKQGSCVTVVLASEGYPGKYEKGIPITGVEDAERSKSNVDVYHAGTKRDADGNFFTNGGRVLNVSAWSDSLEEAISTAYESAASIDFKGKYCRRDIGLKGVARLTRREY